MYPLVFTMRGLSSTSGGPVGQTIDFSYVLLICFCYNILSCMFAVLGLSVVILKELMSRQDIQNIFKWVEHYVSSISNFKNFEF